MNGMPFGYSNIKSIIVNESNPQYKSIDGVLYDKQGKTLIAFPGGKETVTFPNTITSLSHWAFFGAQKLTEVALPEGLTELPYALFRESSVTSVCIPEGVTTIWSDAFYKCTNLTSVILPEGLTTINNSAFDQTGLTKITIPSSVNSIAQNAFACPSLKEIHCIHSLIFVKL